MNAIRRGVKLDSSCGPLRLDLSDALNQFCDYTDSQGEGVARRDIAYSVITRTIYPPFGLDVTHKSVNQIQKEAEGKLSEAVLSFVQAAEQSAAAILLNGMQRQHTRKQIKADIRNAVQRVASVFRDLHIREMSE